MAIFKRIRDIVTASIHDILDKVEDPGATLEAMIREMERVIADLRKDAATAIAGEKVLEKRLERLHQEKTKCEQQAETAIRHNRDDLAKEALAKKRGIQETEALLTTQLKDQGVFVSELRENLRDIEEKVQEARIKRDTLLAKKYVAASRQRLMQQVEEAEDTTGTADALAQRVIGGYDAAARLQEDVERRAAESDAKQEVIKLKRSAISELEALQKNDDVEQELDRMKRKLEE